jgi:Ni,Fe-hydrogenase III small subunit
VSRWVLKGLATGIKTTGYPDMPEQAPGTTPGLPAGADIGIGADEIASRCPTGALLATGANVAVDERLCVHCYRCVRDVDRPLPWRHDYEWAFEPAGHAAQRLGAPFRRSIHIIVVDAGDCGACLNEVKQLNNPYYNMHRLGFFITPTPRHADILLVVGPVTEHMRVALRKVYDAMPTPKRVVAVGACALSGGIFAGSFVCETGVSEVLPVDVAVPGNPPPPLAILHGLLVATGRKRPASGPISSARETNGGTGAWPRSQ